MLRPIEPIRPSLSSKYLKERVELAGAENVVQKHDYEIDAARDLNGLAPYLQCWEQHKRRSRLPSLGDFDEVRRTVGLSGVHLVETPTAEAETPTLLLCVTKACTLGSQASWAMMSSSPSSYSGS